MMSGAVTVVWFIILMVMFVGGIRKNKNQKHPSGRQGKPENTDQPVRTYAQRAQSQKPQIQRTSSLSEKKQSYQAQKLSSQSETKQSYQAMNETLWSQSGEMRQTQRKNTQKVSGRALNQNGRDELKDRKKKQNAGQNELFEQNQIVAAAKANTREVERDNDMDAENEHLMDAVYDAIVKGPENTMEFQRDFIAEGMDMLNSFEL